METGTGKTYVYIKTIFELNRRYGWSKFIVVVPSVAIREGVYKTFRITADHFMEHYGKKARVFIYSSQNLTELDAFAGIGGIGVMIINIQAFNCEDAEKARMPAAFTSRSTFRLPQAIDIIKNRPSDTDYLTNRRKWAGLKPKKRF